MGIEAFETSLLNSTRMSSSLPSSLDFPKAPYRPRLPFGRALGPTEGMYWAKYQLKMGLLEPLLGQK